MFKLITAALCACLTLNVFAAESLIAPNASIQKLATGFQYTEGPTADAQGNIYFSDVPRNQRHRWSIDQKHTLIQSDTQGGNGLGFAPNGALYICEGVARRISAILPNGQHTVIVDRYQGKRFNKPNDLWVAPDGAVYFSDPQSPPKPGVTPDYDMDSARIYRIEPKSNKITAVTQNVTRPNGLVGTADGKTLYATDRDKECVYAWDIQQDGSLKNRRVFCKRSTDGMTLDSRGNLYVATDTIEVFNPKGQRIFNFEIPEKPSNVCFGGKNNQTLFITARTSLYAIHMNVKGQ